MRINSFRDYVDHRPRDRRVAVADNQRSSASGSFTNPSTFMAIISGKFLFQGTPQRGEDSDVRRPYRVPRQNFRD